MSKDLIKIKFDRENFPIGVTKKWLNGIANWMVESFEKNNEIYIEVLAHSKATRYLILNIYWALSKNQDGFITIENLQHEQKIELWESAKEFAKGELGTKELIELSKCLYILETLLK